MFTHTKNDNQNTMRTRKHKQTAAIETDIKTLTTNAIIQHNPLAVMFCKRVKIINCKTVHGQYSTSHSSFNGTTCN
jgi:hypothetical protein